VGVDAQLLLVSSTSAARRAVLKLLWLSAVTLSQQQLLGCCVGAVSISDVINFRLGWVIIPKRVCCSEVVVSSACTLTTTCSWVSAKYRNS